jgi:hypothetical protein
MVGLIFLFLNLVSSLFKSKSRLEAENAALRQQLTVLQRKVRGRVQFTNSDRLFFMQLYRWFPAILKAMTIIRPETLVRWHRAGFRRYWRWKSRNLGGRPRTLFGPVAGAFFMVTLENYLTTIGQWVFVVQGLIFVVCVLLFRRGIIGEVAQLLRVKL